MSEQRRTTLTPFGKSDSKSIKLPRKTFRFSFTLSDPNEDSCPVFDYGSVVKTEERKLIRKHREEKEKKPNGILSAFDGSDEDVKRLAKKLEEKYGDKKGKSKSYAELGAGYDETDPFIDNTEAYDEALQEDQDTPCGGYYINSGPLELKKVEVSDQSDTDETSKRKQKRGLPVIDEDVEDEENEAMVNKEEEEGVNIKIKSISDDGPPEIKKARISDDTEEIEAKSSVVSDVEEHKKNKKKRLILEESSVGVPFKVKKPKTVKALLEEKRVQDLPAAEDSKKQTASITSISEAIESVVNASNNDENSNSSHCSQLGTASTTASEDSQEGKSSSQIGPPPLPENLSSELLIVIDQIRRTASVTDNTRKTFCTEINHGLIKLEWKSREFSATNRNLLFSHLAYYLPCTKDTLMRRAKKLFLHKEESEIETNICKLKATIDATMPSLLEKYGNECMRITEDKGMAVTPSNGNTSGGENQQTHDSPVVKLPKRKFPWTEETRGYLREIVRLKNRCYKVLKPRKSTNEEYVTTFIHSKIRTLWPSGWMRTSVLLRESSRPPHGGKSKHSSNHSPGKNNSSRLNVSVSCPSPNPSNDTSHPAYVSPSKDAQHQPVIDDSTPNAVKAGADPLNLLTKITTSLSTSPSHPKISFSPSHHQNSKKEKPESFSVDCLLKRTSENINCNDYNTTLSDLMKDDVLVNGASLPLKNVNSSPVNDSDRNENILDLSSCNNSVSGKPSVIQSVPTNERTTMRASDSVSLSTIIDSKKNPASASLTCKKEVSSKLPLNRKQRLLQLETQTNWHSQSSCDIVINKKTDSDYKWPHSAQKSSVDDGKNVMAVTKDVERRMSEETATATDILSQIISESLLAPSQPPSTITYNAKALEEVKSGPPPSRGQELLYDVMQDLKELNHMSSGGVRDAKQESKNNSYSSTSWPHPTKPSEGISNNSQFHNEFLKHLLNTQDNSASSTPAPPFSRHSVSPYENSAYLNDINKSVYSSSPHRTAQSISSHAGSPAGKVSQINQGCIMKTLPNADITSGNPHRYITQLDYGADDQHLLNLTSSLQYGIAGWPYPGNESQSHQ